MADVVLATRIRAAKARASELARDLGVGLAQVRIDRRGRLLHALAFAPIGFAPSKVLVLGRVLGARARERRTFLIELSRYARMRVIPMGRVVLKRRAREVR